VAEVTSVCGESCGGGGGSGSGVPTPVDAGTVGVGSDGSVTVAAP
jgi:hypothetical protein